MAEREPAALLAAMAPELHAERHVFVALPPDHALGGEDVVATIREPEGLSAVVREDVARARGLAGEFPCAWITLRVRSALDAVGFLAAVTAALASAGISANAVAGFHHDHLFVPWARRDEAMATLAGLGSPGP